MFSEHRRNSPGGLCPWNQTFATECGLRSEIKSGAYRSALWFCKSSLFSGSSYSLKRGMLTEVIVKTDKFNSRSLVPHELRVAWAFLSLQVAHTLSEVTLCDLHFLQGIAPHPSPQIQRRDHHLSRSRNLFVFSCYRPPLIKSCHSSVCQKAPSWKSKWIRLY